MDIGDRPYTHTPWMLTRRCLPQPLPLHHSLCMHMSARPAPDMGNRGVGSNRLRPAGIYNFLPLSTATILDGSTTCYNDSYNVSSALTVGCLSEDGVHLCMLSSHSLVLSIQQHTWVTPSPNTDGPCFLPSWPS
ncbi:hypothetical protein LX36DRAFT_13588 [Colletotrichum falcatum]|nr:hypothetical protein LX36DRAFT_13588 [Colletotrichum falcatum]